MKIQYPEKSALWAVIIVVMVIIVALSGCGTIAGAGKDITKSAEWTKEKMGGSTK